MQDNYSFCDASGISFGGLIATEEGEGLEGVQVDWDWGIGFSFPQFTDATGNYYFSCLTESPPYTFTPHLDTLPANGVTTLDLAFISRHILGLQLLDSPYKLIAADVDRSNSITTLDMLEIRKVILGIKQGFPNNTSWRFVDKNYVFPEPMNPFSEPFPEAIEVINPYNGGLDKDFVAVKVGDVNGSAAVN
ncbi:MAG: hypothetical protein IPL49_09300 [Saprospirales bacterium]|nr:hypothetical protein [Saprospirales bacterium]